MYVLTVSLGKEILSFIEGCMAFRTLSFGQFVINCIWDTVEWPLGACSHQGWPYEGFHCIEGCPHIRGVLYEGFHCIEGCPNVRGGLYEGFYCIEGWP